MDRIRAEKSKEIKDYINDVRTQINAELEAHKNNEITRAEQELDTYINEYKTQIDTIATSEKENIEKI